MGRRKSGRKISGWVIVDKPCGPSSSDIVNKTRWALNANKAGHAGTLDPLATGLLAVALGEATKTVNIVADALKAYHFTVTWGTATSTDDQEGEIIAISEARPTRDAILDVIPQFLGDIQQVPPQFSAVKVDGARAYDLARAGEVTELAARDLFVESLIILNHSDTETQFELVCGKGGYVRSIARDLGQILGCYGHVKELRRIWSSGFTLDDAIDWDTLNALARTEALDDYILPLERSLEDLPQMTCTPESEVRLRNGNPAPVFGPDVGYDEDCWVATASGKAIAIGTYRGGNIHPARVIVPND